MRYIFELPKKTESKAFKSRRKALAFAQKLFRMYGVPVRMSKKGNKYGHIIEKV